MTTILSSKFEVNYHFKLLADNHIKIYSHLACKEILRIEHINIGSKQKRFWYSKWKGPMPNFALRLSEQNVLYVLASRVLRRHSVLTMFTWRRSVPVQTYNDHNVCLSISTEDLTRMYGCTHSHTNWTQWWWATTPQYAPPITRRSGQRGVRQNAVYRHHPK